MPTNPYAGHLGDRDPLQVLRATAGEIRGLQNKFASEQMKLGPVAGRWTSRQIVAHLADCELVFGFRLKQTLAEEEPTVQPFDQDRWAARYANCDFVSALRLFEAARNWNLLLIEGTSADERQRQVTHPERGTMTFWTIVETMGGHDLNHLGQLRKLIGES
jgi:hypothetical protein